MSLTKKLQTLAVSGALALGVAEKINADVIGYWNFNEGFGNVAYDSSGQERDGVINEAVYTSGKSGTGLYFDGNSYVNIPNTSSLNLPSQFSLSAWIKFNEYNDDNVIIGKHISGYVNGYTLGVQDNRIYFYVNNPPFPGEDRLRTSQDYNDGNWHHVVGAYDGTTQYLYVDNVLQAWQNKEYSIFNSANLRMGGIFEGQDNGAFIGSIDEVKIYDEAVPEPATLGLLGLGALILRYGKTKEKLV